jgi:hypothetical protein
MQVASEDTVLAAVRSYIRACPKSSKTAANEELAPLIRCQHLSVYWLSTCVLAKDEGQLSLLFAPFRKQLKTLLMMRLADQEYMPTQEQLQEHFQGAPASWGLGRRAFRGVHSVQLTWVLPVSELRSKVQRASELKGNVSWECPSVSAPLGGMTWSMLVQAHWDAEKQAARLGLYCVPANAPREVWYRYRVKLHMDAGVRPGPFFITSQVLTQKTGRGAMGFNNFFGTGYMSGGWDEAAWVAAGLPTEGEVRVTLTVMATNNAGIMPPTVGAGFR